MSSITRTLKAILLWTYGRTTWQYDVFCVLILAFIFLTPKSWFENSQLSPLGTHQKLSVTAARLVVWPENFKDGIDRQELERRVRVVTNRPDAQLKDVREVRDSGGNVVAYEVDIQ